MVTHFLINSFQTELRLPQNKGEPTDERLPESILKQVDLSAKPADGSEEFLQVSHSTKKDFQIYKSVI